MLLASLEIVYNMRMMRNKFIKQPLMNHWKARLFRAGVFCLCVLPVASTAQAQQLPAVTVKAIQGGEAKANASGFRQVIVSQTVNPPAPFPGYGGSIAWDGVGRSQRGTLVVAFNAGYWHGSPATPYVKAHLAGRLEDEGTLHYSMGLPHVDAPTGGRIMFVRSEDGGKTWSKPKTLADTPDDDRQAGVLALPDGTWICSWFTYVGQSDNPWIDTDLARRSHTFVARSMDDGRTWSKPIRIQVEDFSPMQCEGSDGPPTLRKDGSILITSYGYLHTPVGGHEVTGFYASQDSGSTWKFLSSIKTDHDLEETHAVELPDGRLVMIARPNGDIAWSPDGGKTWTPPVAFGMRMYAPTLYVLRDGTLVCLHASFAPGHAGLHAIFSTDGGHTWLAPSNDHGFLVDGSVYGYGAGVVLPDDSIYLVYQNNQSLNAEQMRNQALFALRMRVRPDHSGIDLLPPLAN